MIRYVAAGLVFSAVLGVLLLPYPFHGDQALYTLGASMLRDGAVLYADYWDLKQPGLFLFYLAGGTLFGFHEVGIHLFELIYLLLGAALITWLLRDRFESRIGLGLVPALPVGAYYASIVYPGGLTQLEMLVGVPLFLMLWACVEAVQREKQAYWMVGGILAGIVLLFKAMLVLLVAPIWLSVVLPSIRARTLSGAAALRAFASFAAGAILAWLPFVVYVARHDLWDLVVFTFVTFPPQAVELFPRVPSRLVRSAGWFTVMFAPLLLLVGVLWRKRSRTPANGLMPGLLTWLLAGAIVVLLQHWWAYHFYLLLTPLGVLAAMGADRLLAARRGPRSVTIAVAVLCLPLVFFTGRRVGSLLANGFALSPESLLAYQADNWRRYGDLSAVVKEVAFLEEPGTPEGSLYVLGDPVYLYRSGREPASPIIGWSPEMWTPRLWAQTVEDLKESRPPYLFIQEYNRGWLAERGTALLEWIEAHYRPLKQGSAGTWYARSDLDG